MVKLQRPTSLMLAYKQARLEELHIKAILKKNRAVYKNNFSGQWPSGRNTRPLTMTKQTLLKDLIKDVKHK